MKDLIQAGLIRKFIKTGTPIEDVQLISENS